MLRRLKKVEKTQTHVLIIEDEPAIYNRISDLVRSMGYDTSWSPSAKSAKDELGENSVDAILLDVRLEDSDDFGLLKWILKKHPDVPVTVITAYHSYQQAVEATKLGAYEYLSKPIDEDRFRTVLRNAIEKRRGDQKNERLEAENIQLRMQKEDRIIPKGDSKLMADLRDRIRQFASADNTLLITGETGCGKELVARSVHYFSRRRGEAFVVFNCGEFTPELVKNELFGHAAGSYTGAEGYKAGGFQEAEGGVLFLDEIQDLPLPAQASLLRAVESHKVRPIGGEEKHVDVRIIFATNANLLACVNKGTFREDLYGRISGTVIEVPPLRDHKEDIPELATYFVQACVVRESLSTRRLPDELINQMMQYDWPRNVRQLENFIESAVIENKKEELGSELFDKWLSRGQGGESKVVEPKLTNYHEIQWELIEKGLKKHRGNVKAVARELGITHWTIYKQLEKRGLRPEDFRGNGKL